MHLRRSLSLVAALVALSACPAARAAPRDGAGEEGTAAMAEAARARFNEGLRYYAKRKYTQAYAAFLQSYSLTKHPATLLNLGQSALRIGRPLDAARDFQRFLTEATAAPRAQRARAEKGLADARTKLGSVVVNAPAGAEIAIDGESVGRAPIAAPVDVLPGAHEVTMTTPDAKKEQTVRVVEGVEVTVKLVGPAAAGASASARAVVEESLPHPARESLDSPAVIENAEKSAAIGFFSPPESMTPVYVAGAAGILGLTTAIILGGVRTNADRNRSTASDALVRSGHEPATCATTPASDPTIGGACSTLGSAQTTIDQTGGAFMGALVIGAGATLFALGWYFLAPKAGGSDHAFVGARAGSLLVGPARVTGYAGPGHMNANVGVEF